MTSTRDCTLFMFLNIKTLLILKTFTCLLLMQRYRQTSMQKNHESEEIAITRDFRASRMRSPRRSVHSSVLRARTAASRRAARVRRSPRPHSRRRALEASSCTYEPMEVEGGKTKERKDERCTACDVYLFFLKIICEQQ